MTALPPDFDFQEEDEAEDGVQHLVLYAGPSEPTIKDTADHIMLLLVSNFVGLLAASGILSYTWGYVHDFLHLPGVNFHQTFALLVALRVLALVVRL